MTRLLTTGVLLAAALAGAAGAQCNTQPLIGSIGQGTPGTNGVPTLTNAVQVLGSIVLNGADTAPSGGIASVGL